MIETTTSSNDHRSVDVMTALAQSFPAVSFLEFKMRPDRALVWYVNAFRSGERSMLTRATLDKQIDAFLSHRLRNLDASPYRAGDLRFLSGQEDDETFWSHLTGLKFNLLSIDARTEMDDMDTQARLQTLIETILRHGLLDEDGFILTLATAGPLSMLETLAGPLTKRFTKRKIDLAVHGEIGTIRML